jgi:hypothetical protein
MFEAVKAQFMMGISWGFNKLPEHILTLHGWLVSHFGLMATMAIYLTAGMILTLVIWRMVKLSFDILRCVVIPATALALVAAWVLPFSFYHILPVSAALFSGILLLRG